MEARARDTRSGTREAFRARRLILAAGTMGTARIVLRSLGRFDTPVPLVANPYTYVPCVNTAMLGRRASERRHSLTQLAAMLDEPGLGRIHAQAYSYRSLLLFKLAKEAPMAVPEAFRILRDMRDAFVILGIHHEDRPSPGKTCTLRRGEGGGPDVLEVQYIEERGVARRQARMERRLLSAFRKLGCWALKRIHPGHGASIHYGGTVPMCAAERELTVTPSCRLRGTESVYLADGSVLPHLPAKALTLTLMANADRVGTLVAAELKKA